MPFRSATKSPRKARNVRALAPATRLEVIPEADIPSALMAPPTSQAFCEQENGLHICTRTIHLDPVHIAHYSDGTVAVAWKKVSA